MKSRKILAIFLAAILVMMLLPTLAVGAADYNVTDETEFDSALAAVDNGDTIILDNSFAYTSYLEINNGKEFTIDLNGFTLTFEDELDITTGSDVTIIGNLTLTGSVGVYVDGASLTVTGNVTASGLDPEEGWNRAIYCYEGSVTVGGSVTSSGNGVVTDDGTIKITGGVTAGGGGANATNDASITIGGNVSAGGNGIAASWGGTVTVTGNVTGCLMVSGWGLAGVLVNGGTAIVQGSVIGGDNGVYVVSGGSATITGNVTANPPNDDCAAVVCDEWNSGEATEVIVKGNINAGGGKSIIVNGDFARVIVNGTLAMNFEINGLIYPDEDIDEAQDTYDSAKYTVYSFEGGEVWVRITTSTPQTGDSGIILIWIALLLSLMAISGALTWRKRVGRRHISNF